MDRTGGGGPARSPQGDSTPGATRPRYSLVLSAWNSHETMRRSLESLMAQRFRDFEILVVDSSDNELGAEIARQFPGVTVIRPGRRMSPHEARNTGARQARGEYLVFTDPDCVADPAWLLELDRSIGEGRRFVGSPIACWPGGVLEEAVFLAKFWKWLPGGGPRELNDIPSASMAVDRGLYDAAGGVPEANFSGDTAFCHRVREISGLRPWMNDSAATAHINEDTSPGVFPERLRRGRAFALMRGSAPGWTRWHSLALALSWPLLVARHTAIKFMVCLRRGHFRLFLRTWPFVLGLDIAWMLGQALGGLGLLAGGGGETKRRQQLQPSSEATKTDAAPALR